MLGGIGAIEKHKTNTISKIGKTAFRVSLNFSLNVECKECNRTYHLSYYIYFIKYNIEYSGTRIKIC